MAARRDKLPHDFNIDCSSAKAEAMFNLVQSLIAQGVQSRATSSSVKPVFAAVQHAGFAALGINVATTPRCDGPTPDSGAGSSRFARECHARYAGHSH